MDSESGLRGCKPLDKLTVAERPGHESTTVRILLLAAEGCMGRAEGVLGV